MNYNNVNEKKLDSFLLSNGEPLIDVNYLKQFNGLKENLENFFILQLVFEATTDGANPGSCELRAFAEIK